MEAGASAQEAKRMLIDSEQNSEDFPGRGIREPLGSTLASDSQQSFWSTKHASSAGQTSRVKPDNTSL